VQSPSAPAQREIQPGVPLVRLDRKDIRLGDKLVGSASAIEKLGQLTKIDDLFEQLKTLRAAWVHDHPDERLPGEYALEIAPDVSPLAAASVMMTAMFAGYPAAVLETASGPVKIRLLAPAPPGDGEAPLPKLLHVQWVNAHAVVSLLEEARSQSGERTGKREVRNRMKVSRSEAVQAASGRQKLEHLVSRISQLCSGQKEACIELASVPWTGLASVAELVGMLHAVALVNRTRSDAESAREIPEITLHFRPKNDAAGRWRIGPPAVRTGPLQTAAGDSPPEPGTGRLPPQEIQKVVRSNFQAIRACYEGGLRKDPDLAGRVAVRFVIGTDGKVISAESVDPEKPAAADPLRSSSPSGSMPDANVVSCVVDLFKKLSFPTPSGGKVVVVYPFTFSPGAP
jgi:hypothetical protein